jgi:flavin reductase (DIM6/NTAB) family NADH-FMN oxidoreductase RutF
MSEADRVKPWAAALGRVPSGLFIITARHDGQETGMLASWVQQCSFDPPQITLAVRQGRALTDWLAASEPFIINILDDTQTDMIVHFGRGFPPDEPAFNGLELNRSEGGLPILSDCLAYLECHAHGSFLVGDHTVFVGHVIGGRVLNEGQSMIHIRKSGLHY